jgi:hypothetical protein
VRYQSIISVVLSFLLPGILWAQPVLYSPLLGNGKGTRFEVIGRSGNFYWIQRNIINRFNKHTAQKTETRRFSFEVFDARLNQVNEIPYQLSDTVMKEYLIAGDSYFDQLLLTDYDNRTRLLLKRYTSDGTLLSNNDTLIDFPGTMQANEFLLVRSQDKGKVLLLGFEPVSEAPPRIHAVLYNSNWKVLSRIVHEGGKIAQPYIQYDFTNFPLEHFDNSPVKVADNGDWLMVAPSRQSNDYLLWHFKHNDSTCIQNVIKQTQGPEVQQTCLSLNNNEEAFAGVLVNAGSATLKKVKVAHYKLAEGRLAYDTTYRFNTMAVDKSYESYQFAQAFVPIPGKGFLFLKEYGRKYRAPLPEEGILIKDTDQQSKQLENGPTSVIFKKDDYTHFSGLISDSKEYNRGNISLHYLPAAEHDSSWSGLLMKTQATELNSSYLSYLCIPVRDKFILFYNNVSFNYSGQSTTTILGRSGEALDEGLVFWKSNNVLDFQKARQIGIKELAVPFKKNGQIGFSIIKL